VQLLVYGHYGLKLLAVFIAACPGRFVAPVFLRMLSLPPVSKITSRDLLLLMIDCFLRSILFFVADRYGSTSALPPSRRTSCDLHRSTS
jgi:hypothetical protein